LLYENQEAWQLYQIVCSQQNIGFGDYGPLWYPSIEFVFNLYEVRNCREVFEKLLLIHNVYCEKKEKQRKK